MVAVAAAATAGGAASRPSPPHPTPLAPNTRSLHAAQGDSRGRREPHPRTLGLQAGPEGSREHRVAQLRNRGTPGASRRSQPFSGPRVGRRGLRGSARRSALDRRGPPPRGRPHPPLTFKEASPRGAPGEQRWPEAGRGQGRCPLGYSCSSRRRGGLRLPQHRAERSPPPSALRASPAALTPPRYGRPACLLRADASQLRSAPPPRATNARPPLK